MKIDFIREENRLTARIGGEIDHHAAREAMRSIGDRIEREKPAVCALDLAGVSFMDSSGLAVVLSAYSRMRELEGEVLLENVPRQAGKVLAAAGIERLVKMTV